MVTGYSAIFTSQLQLPRRGSRQRARQQGRYSARAPTQVATPSAERRPRVARTREQIAQASTNRTPNASTRANCRSRAALCWPAVRRKSAAALHDVGVAQRRLG